MLVSVGLKCAKNRFDKETKKFGKPSDTCEGEKCLVYKGASYGTVYYCAEKCRNASLNKCHDMNAKRKVCCCDTEDMCNENTDQE